MEHFWDKECTKFSHKLWKPPDTKDMKELKPKHWDCAHPKINVVEMTQKGKKPKVNIEFDDVNIPDGKNEKLREQKKLILCEITRLNKEVTKSNITNTVLNRYITYVKQLTVLPDNRKKWTLADVQNFVRKFIFIYKKLRKRGDATKNANIQFLVNKHSEMVKRIKHKVDKHDRIISVKKIKLKLTQKQVKMIRKWMNNCSRMHNHIAYDQRCYMREIMKIFHRKHGTADMDRKEFKKQFGDELIEFFENKLKNQDIIPLDKRSLRAKYIKCEEMDVPYCILANTILRFGEAFNSCVTKALKGQIIDFYMWNKNESAKRVIHIDGKYITEKGFYPASMGRIKTHDKNFKWTDVASDIQLIHDRLKGEYYVHVPMYEDKPEPVEDRKPLIVLDPGQCIFQQGYGVDHVVTIGKGLTPIIMESLKKHDEIRAKYDDTKQNLNEYPEMFNSFLEDMDLTDKSAEKHYYELRRKLRCRRNNLLKAMARNTRKITNLMRELHHKVANYLCKNYDRIMVTDFSSKGVSSRSKDLNRNSKRVLGKLSHSKFREILKHKCEKYGCEYLVVNEAHTSKTCSSCGNYMTNLGSSRTFDCSRCNMSQCRDVNGSINIFIKNRHLVTSS